MHISKSNIDLELRGRLWLWHSAVDQTNRLLHLAKRTEIGIQQENIIAELETYCAELQNFNKNQPDYEAGVQKHSHQLLFDQTYHRPYPTWEECSSAKDAFIELAIIYFYQILNPGHEDPGTAAGNTKEFVDTHLKPIISKFFPSENEQEKFFNLCNDIKTARNQMLGHADGKAFEIKHGYPASRIKMYTNAWKDIDIDYWHSFLESFRVSILEYENEKNSDK